MAFESILQASDQASALCAHFEFLADEAGAEGLLRTVMSKAKGVRADGDNLIVEFENGELMAKGGGNEAVPAVFKPLFAVHKSIDFEKLLTLQYGNGEDYFGELEEDELEDYQKFVNEMGSASWEDVHVLIQENSDYWVSHPHKHNAHGLPQIVCLAHDDPDNPDGSLITPHNPGTQFLKMMLANWLKA